MARSRFFLLLVVVVRLGHVRLHLPLVLLLDVVRNVERAERGEPKDERLALVCFQTTTHFVTILK